MDTEREKELYEIAYATIQNEESRCYTADAIQARVEAGDLTEKDIADAFWTAFDKAAKNAGYDQAWADSVAEIHYHYHHCAY